MLFAIYQWASLVPSFVVNAIERGPLVRLCPADPPNILEYDKYYEKSQNHQGQQLALSRQQRPRIPSGMVKKGRTRIPNGPNGFSNQRITIRSCETRRTASLNSAEDELETAAGDPNRV